MPITDQVIQRCVIRLLQERSPRSSICPSDVARTLMDDEADWRALMPQVREVAAAMAARQEVRITQGPAEVQIDEHLHGPIRLRRGKQFPGQSS